jgi:hypothetical protein
VKPETPSNMQRRNTVIAKPKSGVSMISFPEFLKQKLKGVRTKCLAKLRELVIHFPVVWTTPFKEKRFLNYSF